jgi:hypothetical protein
MSPKETAPMTKFIKRLTIVTHARRARPPEHKPAHTENEHGHHGGCGGDDFTPPAPYGDISDEYLDALDKLLAPEYEKHEFVRVAGPAW